MKRLCERTPEGQKTPKMLEVETRLGCTLEEDFREYYVEKRWGQQRLANRWGVKKDVVFHSNSRNRSRAWVEMLNLPVRRIDEQSAEPVRDADHRYKCEVCEEYGEHFDRAHWIADKDGGGTQSYNILRICPNCHRKLDRDDPIVAERAKEALLFREAKRIVESRGNPTKKRELVEICDAILNRRIRSSSPSRTIGSNLSPS